MLRLVIKWVLIIGLAAWFFSDVGGAIDSVVAVAKACGRLVGQLIDGVVEGVSSIAFTTNILSTALAVLGG